MSDSPHPGRDDGLPNRTRAHRGGGRSPRDGPAGREMSAAISSYRRGFLGVGNRTGQERSTFGVVLADIGRITGEIGILTLPMMFYLPVAASGDSFAIFNLWLAALATMILVGTLIRGGWITPPLTDAPGWVRLFPTLLFLRLGYFNAVLLLAAQGGLVLANGVRTAAVGWLWALAVSGVATLLFPRIVDEWMARTG